MRKLTDPMESPLDEFSPEENRWLRTAAGTVGSIRNQLKLTGTAPSNAIERLRAVVAALNGSSLEGATYWVGKALELAEQIEAASITPVQGHTAQAAAVAVALQ